MKSRNTHLLAQYYFNLLNNSDSSVVLDEENLAVLSQLQEFWKLLQQTRMVHIAQNTIQKQHHEEKVLEQILNKIYGEITPDEELSLTEVLENQPEQKWLYEQLFDLEKHFQEVDKKRVSLEFVPTKPINRPGLPSAPTGWVVRGQSLMCEEVVPPEYRYNCSIKAIRLYKGGSGTEQVIKTKIVADNLTEFQGAEAWLLPNEGRNYCKGKSDLLGGFVFSPIAPGVYSFEMVWQGGKFLELNNIPIYP